MKFFFEKDPNRIYKVKTIPWRAEDKWGGHGVCFLTDEYNVKQNESRPCYIYLEWKREEDTSDFRCCIRLIREKEVIEELVTLNPVNFKQMKPEKLLDMVKFYNQYKIKIDKIVFGDIKIYKKL